MKRVFKNLFCNQIFWNVVFIYCFWLLVRDFFLAYENGTNDTIFLGLILGIAAYYISIIPARITTRISRLVFANLHSRTQP